MKMVAAPRARQRLAAVLVRPGLARGQPALPALAQLVQGGHSCRWPTRISAQARWPPSSAPSWKAPRRPSGFTRSRRTATAIVLDESNRWWRLHLDLVTRLQAPGTRPLLRRLPRPDRGPRHAGRAARHAGRAARYGGPPRGTASASCRPSTTSGLRSSTASTTIINEDGEMAFCYFSLWGPGRVAKLQSDISIMMSPASFRQFVQPYIRQQCQWLDYSLYHLDGVGAIRHLDALLEIEELRRHPVDAGRRPAAGRRPVLVRPLQAHPRRRQGRSWPAGWRSTNSSPCSTRLAPTASHVLMHFETEHDIDARLKIAEAVPLETAAPNVHSYLYCTTRRPASYRHATSLAGADPLYAAGHPRPLYARQPEFSSRAQPDGRRRNHETTAPSPSRRRDDTLRFATSALTIAHRQADRCLYLPGQHG